MRRAIFVCFGMLVMAMLTSCSHREGETSYTVARAAIQKSGDVGERKKLPLAREGKPLIVVDAGHGAEDTGTRKKASSEKALALTTALLLKHQLNQMGYRVLLTRNRDVFVPLEQRAEIANQSNCAIFVSVHYNSAPNPDAHGVEVYYYHKGRKERQDSSKKLAGDVIHSIINHTGARSRGVKFANFCVIRETQMPSILVEGGFMSNTHELKKLMDNRYLEKIAQGIAQGIDCYFQTVR